MSEPLERRMSSVRKRKRVLFGGYLLIIVTFAVIGAADSGDARFFVPFFIRYLAFFVVVLIWTTVALIGSSDS